MLYKEVVPQSYAGFHLPVPDEKTWVEASGHSLNEAGKDVFTAKKLSESYKDTKGQQLGEDFYAGVDKAYSNMTLFGAHITNKAFSAMFDLDKHYSHANEAMLEKALPSYNIEKTIQRKLQNTEDAYRSRVQSDDFWLQTHPRDTVIGKLASDAGELVATLPLYEALGTALPGDAVVGAKLARGAAGPVMPLTARLTTSKVGQFVAKRLINSTRMYLATLGATGGDQKQATAAGITGEAIEVTAGKGLELGGKGVSALANSKLGQAAMQKIASAPLIKKWTANTIAMGGKPFAQDIAHSAWAEEQPLNWWLENGTEARIDKYGPGAMQLSKDLAIIPKSETEGHFVNTRTNETYHYKGAEERQLLFDHLHKDNLQLRSNEDPVMDKLHEAEKYTLQSIAIMRHGKIMSDLTDEEKLGVLGERWDQINQAAAEAPAHLPDLTHAEEEHNIEAERKANPELHALMSHDEQMFGAKFADVSTENTVTSVQKETGISNAPSAAKKVNRVTRESSGKDISPSGFASLNAESVSYLRAPRDRSEVDFINGRSKDAYDKTYQLLKKADGGFFKAEKPVQRFLYHYANKAKLPAGIRQSVLHWLKQSPEGAGKTEAEIFQMAKNVHVRMYDMAKSGHLKREGNLFASNKFEHPIKGTKWSRMLSDESDQAAIAAAQKALARHPEALKGFNTTVKALQKKAFKSNRPEDIQAFKDALDTASRAIKTHVQRGTAKFGEVE